MALWLAIASLLVLGGSVAATKVQYDGTVFPPNFANVQLHFPWNSYPASRGSDWPRPPHDAMLLRYIGNDQWETGWWSKLRVPHHYFYEDHFSPTHGWKTQLEGLPANLAGLADTTFQSPYTEPVNSALVAPQVREFVFWTHPDGPKAEVKLFLGSIVGPGTRFDESTPVASVRPFQPPPINGTLTQFFCYAFHCYGLMDNGELWGALRGVNATSGSFGWTEMLTHIHHKNPAFSTFMRPVAGTGNWSVRGYPYQFQQPPDSYSWCSTCPCNETKLTQISYPSPTAPKPVLKTVPPQCPEGEYANYKRKGIIRLNAKDPILPGNNGYITWGDHVVQRGYSFDPHSGWSPTTLFETSHTIEDVCCTPNMCAAVVPEEGKVWIVRSWYSHWFWAGDPQATEIPNLSNKKLLCITSGNPLWKDSLPEQILLSGPTWNETWWLPDPNAGNQETMRALGMTDKFIRLQALDPLSGQLPKATNWRDLWLGRVSGDQGAVLTRKPNMLLTGPSPIDVGSSEATNWHATNVTGHPTSKWRTSYIPVKFWDTYSWIPQSNFGANWGLRLTAGRIWGLWYIEDLSASDVTLHTAQLYSKDVFGSGYIPAAAYPYPYSRTWTRWTDAQPTIAAAWSLNRVAAISYFWWNINGSVWTDRWNAYTDSFRGPPDRQTLYLPLASKNPKFKKIRLQMPDETPTLMCSTAVEADSFSPLAATWFSAVGSVLAVRYNTSGDAVREGLTYTSSTKFVPVRTYLEALQKALKANEKTILDYDLLRSMLVDIPEAVDYPVIGTQCTHNMAVVMSCKKATVLTLKSKTGTWQVCHEPVLWSPQNLTWVYRFKDVHIPFSTEMNTLQASTLETPSGQPVVKWIMFPVYKDYTVGGPHKISFILLTMTGTYHTIMSHYWDPLRLPDTTFIEAGPTFMTTVGNYLLSDDPDGAPFKTVQFRLDEKFPFAVTSPDPLTVVQLPFWGTESGSVLGEKWKFEVYHKPFHMPLYGIVGIVVGSVVILALIGLTGLVVRRVTRPKPLSARTPLLQQL